MGGCASDFDDYVYDAPRKASTTSQRSAAARLKVPLPDRALLEPQAAPDCEEQSIQQRADKERQRVARRSDSEQVNRSDEATADPNAELTLRIKLEYERECYRQAEARVRDRLKQLQSSTTQTIYAIKNADGAR
jgi:hypothetical protein